MSQPYLSLEAELHDAFWEAEDDGSEVRMMADFLKKHPGTALEMGAGSGRLMFELIQSGHDIEGLELSTDMLALARERANRLAIHPHLHHGDMETWRTERRYSSVLAPAFTLQLAGDPLSTLRHWHSLLVPRGGLYLTVFTPYAELLGDLPEHEWYPDHRATLPDGGSGLLETRHHLDHAHRLLHREHRYSISGDPPRIHESVQIIRWFEHSELTEMLATSGFQVDRVFSDFDACRPVTPPNEEESDGILTYHATRLP